jgi:hypothetical protein
MDFEKDFESWINESLAQEMPTSVKAFSFNLYEPAFIDDVKFGIELIGAEVFDENDHDWACEEVWVPNTRGINIPISYSGDTWEVCLERLKALVMKHLNTDTPPIEVLKSKQGAGIGFVDGDLETIWKP